MKNIESARFYGSEGEWSFLMGNVCSRRVQVCVVRKLQLLQLLNNDVAP